MKIFTNSLTPKNTILLLLILFFISTNCERFIGYNYTADQSSQTAKIYGKVSNIFTSEPIYQAQVKIGSIITHTDQFGEYIIFYKLNKDENRNKPVPIQISSPKYYSYTDSSIFYPENNKLDVKLVYAAPIIQKNLLVKLKNTEYDSIEFDSTEYDSTDFDSLLVCQALIFDFQGKEDIKSVEATFVYRNPLTNLAETIETEMDYIMDFSDSAAYYQTFHIPIYSLSHEFTDKYTIQAFDSSGFWDSKAGQLSQSDSDTLLFPPFNYSRYNEW